MVATSTSTTHRSRVLAMILALGCLSLLVWVASAALLSESANAAPAAPVKAKLKQPGGEEFQARQWGDEWNNGFETLKGYTMVRDKESGVWEYAEKGPRGGLMPSGEEVGSSPPPEVEKHLRPEVSSDAQRSLERALGPQSPEVGTPNTGTQRSLVILVKFPNQAPIGSKPSQWRTAFFGETGSVRDYYEEVSYGKLTIDPAWETHGTKNDGVVGWLKMDYRHPNTAGDTGYKNQKLTRDAIRAANPYINYARYDTNKDGYLSSKELHLTVVVAGYEAAGWSYLGKSIWAHSWALDWAPTVDGVVVGDGWSGGDGGGYTQLGEWHDDHMATIGVSVHELGHDLGMPDLYDYDYSSEGVGNWSVMGGGSWLTVDWSRLGSTPSHPDAWNKGLEGWLTPQQVSGEQVATSIEQTETSPKAVQILDIPHFRGGSGTGEYFLVENRQKVGYDAALPGSGLLVWHIDERVSSNNYEARKLVDLEEADGRRDLDLARNRGDGGDPYPGSANNTRFDKSSNPNSDLYTSELKGRNLSGVEVANISSSSAKMSATISTNAANDDFANARVLPSGDGAVDATVGGYNFGATKEPGEPDHGSNPGGKSVWYQWTPRSSGADTTATIDTAGSNFDTLLGVYTGTTVDSLTAVASNNDVAPGTSTSRVSFAVSAETTYWIAVDGYNGGSGAQVGTVSLHVVQRPANDDFVDAKELVGESATVTGNNVGATKEPGEPNHAGNSRGRSVWYAWTPPSDMRATIDTDRSDFNAVLAVYTGDTVATLSEVASADARGWGGDTVRFEATAGTTYQIAVDTNSGYEYGRITLHLQRAPANDDFADAQVVTGDRAIVSGSNIGATKEAGEPSNQDGKSVWYEWTPQTSGTAILEYTGTIVFANAYTGSQVDSLSMVAYTDQWYSYQRRFEATAGTTYHIAVDGYSGGQGISSGNFTLRFSVIPTVHIISLKEYQTVRGTIPIAADVTYSRGIEEVVFSLARSGETFNDIWRDSEAPYETNLDTTTLDDGGYNLKATAIAYPDIEGSDTSYFYVHNHAPTITKVTPVEDDKGVSPKTNVIAYFAEEMDEASLEAVDETTGLPTTFTLQKKTATGGLSAPIPAEVTYVQTSYPYKSILNPTTDLRYGVTYVATVTTEAKDRVGNPLAQEKVWTFTTKRR